MVASLSIYVNVKVVLIFSYKFNLGQGQENHL